MTRIANQMGVDVEHQTWEDVRARSEEKFGTLDVYCGDCAAVYHSGAWLPCRRHATSEEIRAIDETVRAVLVEQRNPMFVYDPEVAARIPRS